MEVLTPRQLAYDCLQLVHIVMYKQYKDCISKTKRLYIATIGVSGVLIYISMNVNTGRQIKVFICIVVRPPLMSRA